MPLVFAVAANGHGPEIRSTHPPGTAGDWDGKCTRASATSASNRRGTGGGSSYHHGSNAQSTFGAEHGVPAAMRRAGTDLKYWPNLFSFSFAREQ